MKTSEFKKFMEQTGYAIHTTGKGRLAITSEILPGEAYININTSRVGKYQINNLPEKVASVAQDYAWTPIAERKDEKRWNVVIGSELQVGGTFYTIWSKGNIKPCYTNDSVVSSELDEPENIFTDSEFDDLITCLKSLPNGDTYAKIAELGKREVVDDCL